MIDFVHIIVLLGIRLSTVFIGSKRSEEFRRVRLFELVVGLRWFGDFLTSVAASGFEGGGVRAADAAPAVSVTSVRNTRRHRTEKRRVFIVFQSRRFLLIHVIFIV